MLKLVNKGETYNSTLDGITKAHEVGFDTSVMVLNGLGGKLYSQQHAINEEKLKLFIENIDVENAIFRSDHVSNNVVLKGILSKDKQKLIDTINNHLPLL